ncbi:hypothetical protein [Kluyvera ascorbata]|uniref:hypothetical protein n=1 Tax=Kluyvera ascorbata TaxID=51288 RepID=UPI0022E503E1|nr:hypothetical protein [Kluyvera ascorbata]
MNDITALAQRMKVYAEEFSYPVLSPDDCRALVEALEARDKQIADYAARLNRLEKRCDHKGSVYWDVSGVKRCARCAAGIQVIEGEGQ